ncbi:MAG: hypothetical protein K6E59_01920 [Bacilli bacterium]|nr:hypothetical protein [Bacilli bacterium]
MKSSSKTALIVVLAVIAAGGALAAGYGLSNTFHNWVDTKVIHKDAGVYIPKGATENDDGTITIKTSFAHQDKHTLPFTGGYTYYTLPDFEIADVYNSNGKLEVVNGTFSNGEHAAVMLASSVTGAYLNIMAEDQYEHCEDVKFYSDYDEALAKEEGAFFYAPYADVKDFAPKFSAKKNSDESITVSVTYVPKGAKFTGEKDKVTSSSSSASTSASN